jgi:tetratricopeptide (TPR) repeat protein
MRSLRRRRRFGRIRPTPTGGKGSTVPEAEATPLFEMIGRIHVQRGSGVLVVQRPDSSRRLYFRAGELYLAPNHPLARSIKERLETRAQDATDADSALRKLAARIAHALSGWNEDPSRFVESEEEIPDDAVGPLPTEVLLAEGSVAGWEADELLELLGGEEAIWRSVDGAWRGERHVQLDPKQAYLLSRLDRPELLRALLAQPGLDRDEAVRNLRQLHALGLVERVAEREAVSSGALLPEGLLERFLDRIQRSLEEKPVDLGHETHRLEVRSLLDEEPANYFKLLRMDVHATLEEIYRAYLRLARRTHPMHAVALGLTERMDDLRELFRRLTEAYLTLSDPDRRSAYTAAVLPPASATKEQQVESDEDSERRRKERSRLARQHFQEAAAHAKLLDYHYAVQLLTQAVEIDPRPEYYALLGTCQAHNPRWLDRAATSFSSALELDPMNAELWVDRAQVMEKIGKFEEARRSYARALALRPAHVGAQLGLDSLRHSLRKRSGGLLGALRRLFGG